MDKQTKTERQTDRQVEKNERQTDGQTKKTERQTEGQRQTGKDMRQTDIHTERKKMFRYLFKNEEKVKILFRNDEIVAIPFSK